MFGIDDAIVVGGIGAGLSALGGLFANHQSQTNWEKQQMYNTPAKQVQRLQEAGINPQMAMSQINTGNATTAPDTSQGTAMINNGMQVGAQLFAAQMQKRLIAANVKRSEAEADMAATQASKMRGIDTDFEQGQLDFLRGPQTQLTFNQAYDSAAMRDLHNAMVTNTNQDTLLKSTQMDLNRSMIGLNDVQRAYVQETVDTYYQKFAADVAEIKSRIGANNASSYASYAAAKASLASAANQNAQAFFTSLESKTREYSPAQLAGIKDAYVKTLANACNLTYYDYMNRRIDYKYSDEQHEYNTLDMRNRANMSKYPATKYQWGSFIGDKLSHGFGLQSLY